MADEAVFSDHVFNTSFQEEFKKYWNLGHDVKSTNLEIISKPYRVCRISNFLRNEIFIENLKSELEDAGHSRSCTDLYKNEQSDELCNVSGKHIQILYESFKRDLSVWMRHNTGIHLDGNISMRSARYYDTDRLLCHDDHTATRRIAFIIYLTKDWTERDGGTLDLFEADEYSAPQNVVNSLIPKYNSFVFFEVVDNSYHQIAEITSKDKSRWALSGWFLGSEEDYRRLRRFKTSMNYIRPWPTEETLSSWISKTYLLPGVKRAIQNDMEDRSYILLKDFFIKSVYQKIVEDLMSQDIKWKMIGPADIRHYEIADEETLPEVLKEFYNLFKSISFFQLLKEYTDLDLMPLKKKRNKPKMTIELQRWSAGCYTLLYNRSLMEDHVDASKKSVQSDDDQSNVSIPNTSNTSCTSTDNSNTSLNVSPKMRQELKRRKIDSSSPCHEEKVTRRLETPSDISMQSSSTDEYDNDVNENALSESNCINRKVHEDSDWSYCLLDLIMQFNTLDVDNQPKTDETIDYIDVEQDNTMIQIPSEDNHFSLVYRSMSVCRLQQYLNHYYKGYSYALVCEYHE